MQAFAYGLSSFPLELQSLFNPSHKAAEDGGKLHPRLLSAIAWFGHNSMRRRNEVLGDTSQGPFSMAVGLCPAGSAPCWLRGIILFHLGISIDILENSSNDHFLSKKKNKTKNTTQKIHRGV